MPISSSLPTPAFFLRVTIHGLSISQARCHAFTPGRRRLSRVEATMRCRWATLHWIRFAGIETPDSIDISHQPQGAASWKIGPDGPLGPDGSRLPGNIWCAVGLYPRREQADALLDDPDACMPYLSRAEEAWHAVLQPIAHRGECNHLNRDQPGEMFTTEGHDPGGNGWPKRRGTSPSRCSHPLFAAKMAPPHPSGATMRQ